MFSIPAVPPYSLSLILKCLLFFCLLILKPHRVLLRAYSCLCVQGSLLSVSGNHMVVRGLSPERLQSKHVPLSTVILSIPMLGNTLNSNIYKILFLKKKIEHRNIKRKFTVLFTCEILRNLLTSSAEGTLQ